MAPRRGGVRADQTIEEMAKLKREWSIEALRDLKRVLTDDERLGIALMLESDPQRKSAVQVTKKQFELEAVFYWKKMKKMHQAGRRWTADQRKVVAEAAIQMAELRHPSKRGTLSHEDLFKRLDQSLNKRVKNKNEKCVS